ncbi:MAG: NPCBM/NEW2 domain-containing protein [Planctomycetia bacterium]|nr:NPCBM/NEW2 domain-containing protein [Planctomycetia bacterium]
MLPLVLALTLAAPEPPSFIATGTGDETPTGQLTALSLKLGAQVKTPLDTKIISGLINLRRADIPPPALPVSAQLITAGGDRLPGAVNGGDAKVIQFRPTISDDDWPIALDSIAAVWLVAPPADTPTDPARYTWLAGTPPRDVLLYRNGDVARGVLSGFTDTAVTFTPGGAAAREVSLKDLAAIGFNPRFVRVRKPKEAFAHLVLTDGTRLNVTEPAVKENAIVAKALCGPAVEIPLTRIVSLDVLQGSAVYLSDLKPKKAEIVGFLGDGWTWRADRTVRGQPLRLLTKEGEGTFDKGLGTHPKTVLTYDLAGKFTRFEALVGLDAATGKRGRADVRIRVDGKEVDLPALKSLVAGPAVPVRVDVRGAKELVLVVDFGPAGDVQADVNWADARLVE